MANLGIEIKRKCPICGKVFIIKTLDSVYCSPKCSKIANKRKKDKEKKEDQVFPNWKHLLLFDHLSEGIQIFLIVSDRRYTSYHSHHIKMFGIFEQV